MKSQIKSTTCDRCGNVEEFRSHDFEAMNRWGSVSTHQGTHIAGDNSLLEKDICPQCSELLREWWFSGPAVVAEIAERSMEKPIRRSEHKARIAAAKPAFPV